MDNPPIIYTSEDKIVLGAFLVTLASIFPVKKKNF